MWVPTGKNVFVTLAELTYIATSLSICNVSGRLILKLFAVPVTAFLESTMILNGSVVSVYISVILCSSSVKLISKRRISTCCLARSGNASSQSWCLSCQVWSNDGCHVSYAVTIRPKEVVYTHADSGRLQGCIPQESTDTSACPVHLLYATKIMGAYGSQSF